MTKRTATKKKPPAKKATSAARKPGRPTKYSPELVEEIFARLRLGEPLAEICRSDERFPHPSTMRDWADKDPAVSLALARAREDGEDAIAADILRIADSPLRGELEKRELRVAANPTLDDDTGALPVELVTTEVRVVDCVDRAKLMIEARFKLLKIWNPKKYGDKVELGGTLTLAQLVGGATE